jgi:hypothetical protein
LRTIYPIYFPSSSLFHFFLEGKTMENPLIEKSRKEIQTALRSLAMEHSMPVVDEWREVLRVTGRCTNLSEAIDLLKECVHDSEVAGERIEKPKHSGKWIAIVLSERQRIARQSEIIRSEESERDRRRREESERISHEASTLGGRIKEAQELIPLLKATLDDRSIQWAGFAAKNPTPFILHNCRRLLRAHSIASPDVHAYRHSNESTAYPNQATQDQENAATVLQMQTVA